MLEVRGITTFYGAIQALHGVDLDVTRGEVEAYAVAHELAWVDDESNQDVYYLRNFLRHEVLPRIEVRVKDGLISDVKGGGLYGEGLKLFQNYPGTKELTWPMQKKPGYWWLYEAGMGTNPKYFKHPGEVGDGKIFVLPLEDCIRIRTGEQDESAV